MSELPPPVAHLEIDQIVKTFELGVVEPWEDALPAAYDVACVAAAALLRRDFVVVFDSTFTYVPVDGREPVFHEDQVTRLADVARDAETPLTLAHLSASLPELLRRRENTGRLTPAIIEGTHSLHETVSLPVRPTLELATDELEPAELDERVLALAVRVAAGLEAHD
jgi:hypothetical protein